MQQRPRRTLPSSSFRRLVAGAALPLLGLALLAAGAVEAPGRRPPPGLRLEDGVLVPDEPLRPGKESATGLEKPFPPAVLRPDNPTTPARVELGRLLFFDPLLSGDNRTSCAHCHHPDLGFSDGLPRARGRGAEGVGAARAGGVELHRATPTLWNALYNERQFWDGRAADLEEQARGPITHPDEMGEDPERLEAKLRAIPGYVRFFERAFGGEGEAAVSFESTLKAIAAFERTLVSFASRYDRFAAGESSALDEAEVRGLKLFLSTKTRCNECHTLPSFASRDFKVIGVPDPPEGPRDEPHPDAEPGRGGGPQGAFKVPALRNIALTAPYMHNGIFRTLEEVIDFYAAGGGRGRGLEVPLQDDKVREFPLSPEERSDLVAFLGALTDVSAAPAIPERVPSGLPVVERVAPEAPAAGPERRGKPSPERSAGGLTIEVRPGESIQDAVGRAGRGGTVILHPGVYHQDVLVIHHDFTLRGRSGGERAILDGRGKLADAVVALGDRFTIEEIDIRGFQGNGVVVHGARQAAFRGLTISDPGLYGVYPVGCEGVLVERCRVSGARDAGIYVGQSRDIVVRGNEVFQNVAGIEIENSVNALVEENLVHGNTGGILVFLLPFNPSKVAEAAKVVRNRVLENNTPNFAEPGAIVGNVLQGTGILILGADRTEVTGNEVRGNGSYGIAVTSLLSLYPPEVPLDVEPFADGNWIHSNRLEGNGSAPDPRLGQLGLPGRDLLWDGTGEGNRWHQPGASSHPEELPGRGDD
jgi:cytochrome c peroxidase